MHIDFILLVIHSKLTTCQLGVVTAHGCCVFKDSTKTSTPLLQLTNSSNRTEPQSLHMVMTSMHHVVSPPCPVA